LGGFGGFFQIGETKKSLKGQLFKRREKIEDCTPLSMPTIVINFHYPLIGKKRSPWEGERMHKGLLGRQGDWRG